MDIKKFFKERIGFTDKEIEIKVEPDHKEKSTKFVPEEKDERVTRRRLFESKMLKIFSLALGMNIMTMPRQAGPEFPYKLRARPEKLEVEQELEKRLGDEYEAFLKNMTEYAVAKEKTTARQGIQISNFKEFGEKLPDEEVDEGVGIKADKFNDVIKMTYPSPWLEKVGEFRFVPHELDLPKDYGIKNGVMAAYAERRGMVGGANIIFGENLKNVWGTLSHELAHANDWQGRTDLSPGYRINLLHATLKRVQSADRFQSAYVESITNEDKKKELMLKATEYWAEINQFYFDKPAMAKTRLAAADLELIENHLKMLSGEFNAESAARERQVRMEDLTRGAIISKIQTVESKVSTEDKKDIIERLSLHAPSSAKTAEAVSGIDTAKKIDQELALNAIFANSKKSWAKADHLALEEIDSLSALSNFYKKGEFDNKTKKIIEELLKTRERLNQELEKFSKKEQIKIRDWHRYMEKTFLEEEINPLKVTPELYYQ